MSDEDFVRTILLKYYNSEEIEKRMIPHYYSPKKYAFSLIKQVQKHGRIKAELIFDEYIKKQRKKGTLEGYIDRYGEEKGTKKYYEKNRKLSVGIDSLKERGYSDSEIQEIKRKHGSKSDSSSLTHFIEKYGHSEGAKKYIDSIKHKKLKSPRCVEFWINKGYSIEEATRKVSFEQTRGREYYKDKGYSEDKIEDIISRQTKGFMKQWYIDKYGEETGIKLYIHNCSKGSDINHYIDKYGEEQGTKIYKDVMDKRLYKSDFLFNDSKIQIEFASLLYDSLPTNLQKMFYGAPITERPFILNFNKNEYNRKIAVPDIKIKNVFVEFDGSYWHSSEEAKARDIIRDELCLDKGYITIRVDENKFKQNKIKVIDETVQIIKEVINENQKNHKE